MRILLPLLLLAGPALAQSAPRLLPSHDATVVYRVSGAAADAIPGGIPGTVRVAWSAEQQRLRVEPQGRTQVLLVDLDAATVQAVDSSLRTAMSLPVRPRDLQPLTLQDARLTRRGRAVVAGRSCTEYAAESRRGHGTVCLTEDGVALRAEGEVDGKQGSFTAVSVSYDKLPPRLFEVPPGYFQLALPRASRPP
jgi:hypothetical protein